MSLSKYEVVGWTVVALLVICGAPRAACAQATATAYASMAPLDQYLMPDLQSEIALARSAAPASISDSAEVMVLGRDGYTVAVHGENGFVCLVERSWVMATDNPEFWNPKIRSPNCWNSVAARTFVPFDLMKTKLALAGKSKAEIARTVAAALGTDELPAVAPGALCYMMSKEQYLNDGAKSWYSHVMFYAPGDARSRSGANLPGSPVSAFYAREVGATVFQVLVRRWSDGTPAPQRAH